MMLYGGHVGYPQSLYMYSEGWSGSPTWDSAGDHSDQVRVQEHRKPLV